MNLFTIGYAGHTVESLIAMLKSHQITALADVRSSPFSGYAPMFNRDVLKAHLQNNGIAYVWLGLELGPRSSDPSHYDDSGQVQFDKLQESELFFSGIQRVDSGLTHGHKIALMCAEKDPATCHRSILIATYVGSKLWFETHHILSDGGLETQTALEERLMLEHGILPDMLREKPECIKLALKEREKRVAYKK